MAHSSSWEEEELSTLLLSLMEPTPLGPPECRRTVPSIGCDYLLQSSCTSLLPSLRSLFNDLSVAQTTDSVALRPTNAAPNPSTPNGGGMDSISPAAFSFLDVDSMPFSSLPASAFPLPNQNDDGGAGLSERHSIRFHPVNDGHGCWSGRSVPTAPPTIEDDTTDGNCIVSMASVFHDPAFVDQDLLRSTAVNIVDPFSAIDPLGANTSSSSENDQFWPFHPVDHDTTGIVQDGEDTFQATPLSTTCPSIANSQTQTTPDAAVHHFLATPPTSKPASANSGDQLPGWTNIDHRFRTSHVQKWQQRYHEMVQFKCRFGHCIVPLESHENGPLAHWVKRQRCQYKIKMAAAAKGKPDTSTLTDERQRLLTELGFMWDVHKGSWKSRIEEIKVFVEMNGHCRIPCQYPANQSLATWVKCQRRQYKLFQGGEPSNISQVRVDELSRLGFIWEGRSKATSAATATAAATTTTTATTSSSSSSSTSHIGSSPVAM